MKISSLTIVFVLLLTSATLAQERTPRADDRQAAQRGRIAEGRRSGELTHGEAALLNNQQRHIRRIERRAKADGNVTVRERRRLEQKQDRASRNIRRVKSNELDKN